MWCVPELDDVYISRMEDVLDTDERPLDASQPVICRQCLGTRRISSLDSLQREAKAWNRRINRNRVTIQWAFTRRKARAKFDHKPNRIRRSKN
jgi:hypothetical protein